MVVLLTVLMSISAKLVFDKINQTLLVILLDYISVTDAWTTLYCCVGTLLNVVF